jgi:hypothetical protein
LAERLAAGLKDRRAPQMVVHRLAEIIRFRMLMIAAGYQDGNDADMLRRDPMVKLALDRLPSDEELCSQSTISRLENLPDVRALLRLGRALIELFCASFRQVPKRVLLDIDDTPAFARAGSSTESIAASSCGCSTPFMRITVFSRSWCSTARGVSSRPCCGLASGRVPRRRLPHSKPSGFITSQGNALARPQRRAELTSCRGLSQLCHGAPVAVG